MLNLTEAGLLKNITRQTVKNWITTNKIPKGIAQKVGKLWFIEPEGWAKWEPTHDPKGGWPKGRKRKRGVTTH